MFNLMRELKIPLPSKIKILEKQIEEYEKYKLAEITVVEENSEIEAEQLMRVNTERIQLLNPDLGDEVSKLIFSLTQQHKEILDDLHPMASELLQKSHPQNLLKVNP